MLYIYKKNNTYIYKRRIPHLNKFYTFNTTFKNYKKASKLVIIFNKITRDIFEYIKQKGKAMAFDFNEVFEVLNDYREKALLEKVSKLVHKEEYQATIRESFDDLMKHSRNYQMQRMEGKDND